MNFQGKCTSLYTNQRVSKYASGLSACPIAGFKHTNSLSRRWTAAACAAAIILRNSASRHYATTDSPSTTLECPNYCKNCSSVQGNSITQCFQLQCGRWRWTSTIHLFRGFPMKNKGNDGRKMKGQITTRYEHKSMAIYSSIENKLPSNVCNNS